MNPIITHPLEVLCKEELQSHRIKGKVIKAEACCFIAFEQLVIALDEQGRSWLGLLECPLESLDIPFNVAAFLEFNYFTGNQFEIVEKALAPLRTPKTVSIQLNGKANTLVPPSAYRSILFDLGRSYGYDLLGRIDQQVLQDCRKSNLAINNYSLGSLLRAFLKHFKEDQVWTDYAELPLLFELLKLSKLILPETLK